MQESLEGSDGEEKAASKLNQILWWGPLPMGRLWWETHFLESYPQMCEEARVLTHHLMLEFVESYSGDYGTSKQKRG